MQLQERAESHGTAFERRRTRQRATPTLSAHRTPLGCARVVRQAAVSRRERGRQALPSRRGRRDPVLARSRGRWWPRLVPAAVALLGSLSRSWLRARVQERPVHTLGPIKWLLSPPLHARGPLAHSWHGSSVGGAPSEQLVCIRFAITHAVRMSVDGYVERQGCVDPSQRVC